MLVIVGTFGHQAMYKIYSRPLLSGYPDKVLLWQKNPQPKCTSDLRFVLRLVRWCCREAQRSSKSGNTTMG